MAKYKNLYMMTSAYAPMGAVCATEEVVAPLAARGEDLMFYTFGAHPVACAVADAVLEIMEREGLVRRAAPGTKEGRKEDT